MSDTVRQVRGSREVLRFTGTSPAIEHLLHLLLDTKGEPLLFHAHINAPVCIDNICKPVHIKLYWNLVGDYVGYGTLDAHPLTKFDHEEFEAEDHEELHRLLQDRHSVLSTKEMSDLFDPNATPKERIRYQGIEVDAVTGATRKEIQETVVEGALYSCYTIWHLVHGEVASDIRHYLGQIYTPAMAQRFLHGHEQAYQYHALRQLDDDAFAREIDRVIEIFAAVKPLIRTYILKRIPASTLEDQQVTAQVFRRFPSVDINTRTLLIKKADVAHASAMELLSAHLSTMTKNQLKLFLATLAGRPSAFTGTVEAHLQQTSRSSDYAYGYLIEEFLQNRADQLVNSP